MKDFQTIVANNVMHVSSDCSLLARDRQADRNRGKRSSLMTARVALIVARNKDADLCNECVRSRKKV